MSMELCDEILETHPAESISMSVDGEIMFANARARKLIIRGEEKFPDLWSESRERVLEIIGHCAGGSTWQPFALTRKGGGHDGVKMRWRGRGYRRDGKPPMVAIVGDESHTHAFEEHRKLVRELNEQLAHHMRMEAKLDEALTGQQKLHRELVHRVKNNLSILSALIRLRANSAVSEETRDALKQLESRTMAMALVHQMLDRNQQIDRVDAAQVVEQLCGIIESSILPPNVKIIRDLTPHPLHIDDATPLCLLVNELVTNSIKHAFSGSDSGEVHVRLKKNGVDKLEVHVADNGAGFSEAGDGKGSGTRIVRALTEQLRGDLHVESENGTVWQLIFPPVEPGRITQTPPPANDLAAN
ncbi:sensor histidine kinase [Tepidamorphus sp. 3E244]|uniref:sensor histidine kinase n=1 Tax=Tepidamorphus sp. 3E244 TaxID=3385498 RepID=UPI0038FC2A47